jgi:hypothetical protein
MWTSPERTPPLFPDAVTLEPGASRDQLLSSIDGSHGCSVKDSFADLALDSYGFEVLFEAAWIRRRPRDDDRWPRGGGHRWRAIAPDEVRAWERAWAPDGPIGLFRPELLASGIDVLGGFGPDGEIVAGAVVCVADGVVGLSNVFGPDDERPQTWGDAVRTIVERDPSQVIVGYEAGDDLAAARSCGFEAVGPLRVWHR